MVESRSASLKVGKISPPKWAGKTLVQSEKYSVDELLAFNKKQGSYEVTQRKLKKLFQKFVQCDIIGLGGLLPRKPG